MGSSRAVLGASWSEGEGSRGKASGPRFRGKRPDTDLGPSSPGRRSRGWSLDSKSQGFGYGVALDLSLSLSVLGSAVPPAPVGRQRLDGRGTPLPPAHRISSQPRKVSVQVSPGRREASAQQEASDKAIQPQRTGRCVKVSIRPRRVLIFFFSAFLSSLALQ